MEEFIKSSLPFFLIGLSIALFALNYVKKLSPVRRREFFC